MDEARESAQDLIHLYELLADLRKRLGGFHYLKDSDGQSDWPRRGVYFFFDRREQRGDRSGPRVVRIGTHGLRSTDRTTLWGRLRNHKGTSAGMRPGGGNHRGSVFRHHVGAALLLARGKAELLSTWMSPARPPGVAEIEYETEREVSRYIGELPLLWVGVEDDVGPSSDRGKIERNSIALLSSVGRDIDPPQTSWLGHQAPNGVIGRAGLWNVRHVGDGHSSSFLVTLDRYISAV